jgi:hypothetical protein
MKMARNPVSLKGTKNGDATSVAIMFVPSGNLLIRGVAIVV